MRFSLVLVNLLCFTEWMSMVHATHGPGAICCMQWSDTKIPLERVANYTIQSDDICPIKAIRLQSKLGKTICSNPESQWARKAVQKVNDEKNKKTLQDGQNEDGSTTDITPTESTPSTTSKNIPQKQVRNRRRHLKKRFRRGKTRLRKRA